MATIGFERVYIGVMDENENTKEVFTIDAQKGGAIEAKISGLGATMNTVYASNIHSMYLHKVFPARNWI